MTARRSPGPWRAAQISIRGHKVWAVRNSHRDPVAVVYTGEADARVMAASLAFCRYVQKRARSGDPEAQALMASINGGH